MQLPEVIFEDEDILVINKPAGMIVNRADTTRHVTTVQEWAENKLNLTPTGREDENDFIKRGGVVHRLDKETSGALILAKNEEAFVDLQRQFREGHVDKVYVALVHGNVSPQEGEINVPIGRLPWNRTRFGVLAEGRESKTLYKVLETKHLDEGNAQEDLTLIEAYPKTGRTHQIRVHFRYLGYPLFADELYAGRKTMKKDRKLLARHFLHAKQISFAHPKTKEKLTLQAPLSSELVDFLTKLQ